MNFDEMLAELKNAGLIDSATPKGADVTPPRYSQAAISTPQGGGSSGLGEVARKALDRWKTNQTDSSDISSGVLADQPTSPNVLDSLSSPELSGTSGVLAESPDAVAQFLSMFGAASSDERMKKDVKEFNPSEVLEKLTRNRR